jgi:AcrR family transcriptional regulator
VPSRVPRKSTRETFHHGDTRRAAVEAALALLATDGRDALTLRAVAEQIGVNHRALYRHFASLDALKVEVATAGFERLADALEEVPPGEPRELASSYARFALANGHLYDLMFSMPLRKWYGAASGIGPAVRRVTAASIVGIGGMKDAKARVFRIWGLVHGLLGLYRTETWRAANDRKAVEFIASLV